MKQHQHQMPERHILNGSNSAVHIVLESLYHGLSRVMLKFEFEESGGFEDPMRLGRRIRVKNLPNGENPPIFRAKTI